MYKTSIIIPAYNEEKNIAKVIKCLKKCNINGEIIVVDNNSTDNTNKIANSLGIKTLFCEKKGKGYAMKCGIDSAMHSNIVFVDADICNYSKNFIHKMIKPLIEDDFDFIKASFSRTGGRITELVVKPLLELTFPKLRHFDQPLSGIISGKKELFKQVKFENDYGVDIGILIDFYKMDANMGETYIGKIKNDSQSWKDLTIMARQVTRAILSRSDNFYFEEE